MPRKGQQPTALYAYRDLLNGVIEDVNGQNTHAPGPLSSSRIGASFWKAVEKDALFRQLQLSGCRDLPALCRALPNKSQSEIVVFLSLLREKSSTRPVSHRTEEKADCMVPAACQISRKCESALNTTAHALSTRLFEQDREFERQVFGESWLIDPTTAEQLEEDLDEQNGENEDSAEPRQEELAEPNVGQDASPPPHTAESLLRPVSFLQLSKSLYMNNSGDPELNWDSVDTVCTGVAEPSIFRSAFEDFFNLTMSVTRRLVHATIFQAMTRLRAGDSSRADWTPAGVVRELDVRITSDLLGMRPRWKEYWSTVAQRNKVLVFSDSKKYADGRPGTKVGHQLTDEEVEAELGLMSTATINSPDHIDPAIIEEDVDEALEESDCLTEDSSTDLTHASKVPSAAGVKATPHSTAAKRKRKRSPATFVRIENQYLEAIDHNASADEETRLWKLLRVEPSTSSLHHVDVPPSPGELPKAECTQDFLPSCMEYEAEWEHPLGLVDQELFIEMDVRGRQGRKRRCILSQRVQARLDEISASKANESEDYETDFSDMAFQNEAKDDETDVENRLGEDNNGDNEHVVRANEDQDGEMERDQNEGSEEEGDEDEDGTSDDEGDRSGRSEI